MKRKLLALLTTLGVGLAITLAGPTPAQAATTVAAATDPNANVVYAQGWRVYVNCTGAAVGDFSCIFAGLTTKSSPTYNFGWYSAAYKTTTASSIASWSDTWSATAGTVANPNCNGIYFAACPWPLSQIANTGQLNSASSPYIAQPGTTTPGGFAKGYFEWAFTSSQTNADAVMKRPTFQCTIPGCTNSLYMSFVPIGATYSSSMRYMGDAPTTGTDPCVNAVGSATCSTTTTGGTTGGTTTGCAATLTCTSRPTDINQCINIDPFNFKFDFPCIIALWFQPSDSSVAGMQTDLNVLTTQRQPFSFIADTFRTTNTIFAGTGTCSPLQYSMTLPLINKQYNIAFIPCDSTTEAARNIIRPLSTWVLWLVLGGLIAGYVFRRFDLNITMTGGE